jgi:hypothetical protein
VSFVHEPETQGGLAKAIASSPLGRDSVQGQPGNLKHYQVKVFIFFRRWFVLCAMLVFAMNDVLFVCVYVIQEKLCADPL